MRGLPGYVLCTAGCLALCSWWLWCRWNSSRCAAEPGSSNNKQPTNSQHAACATSSNISVASTAGSRPAVPASSGCEPAPGLADDPPGRASGGPASAAQGHSDSDSCTSSQSSSVHAVPVLLDVQHVSRSTQVTPTLAGSRPSASSRRATSSSLASSSPTAAADLEQVLLAADDIQAQSPGQVAAAAAAGCKQTSPPPAAAHLGPTDGSSGQEGAGPRESPAAAVVAPQPLLPAVDGSMAAAASEAGPAPAPTATAPATRSEALAAAPVAPAAASSNPPPAALSAAPAVAAPAARLGGLPGWFAKGVKVPAVATFWLVWVPVLSQVGRGLMARGYTSLPMEVMVRYALWPTLARATCFVKEHYMRTLSGTPIKQKLNIPQPRRKEEYRLQHSHRIDYTRRVWALRLLVAGLWAAVEAAVPGQGMVRLPLTAATLEVLLQLTWRAYRPLGPGEARPAEDVFSWAPDWRLDQDTAGEDASGQAVTYCIPDLVTQLSDLQQVVIQAADGGAWLVGQYEELVTEHHKLVKGRADCCFLEVDAQQQLLVVDLSKLNTWVGGLIRSADNSVRRTTAGKKA